MSEKHSYTLRGGAEGASRLEILARVKWPSTRKLLERSGLAAGMRCLDVGCGPGLVSIEMAKVVGRAGRIVGLDFDQEALRLAAQRAEAEGLTIDWRAEDVQKLSGEEPFDLIFARFLLTHVPDPAGVTRAMARLLQPGGVLVVEDIEFDGHFAYPPCQSYDRYCEIYAETVRARGADPNIGPKLLGYVMDAGLERCTLGVISPVFFEGEGKTMARRTLEDIRDSAVAAGIATHEEIDRVAADLLEFEQNRRSILALSRMFQVTGRRATE